MDPESLRKRIRVQTLQTIGYDEKAIIKDVGMSRGFVRKWMKRDFHEDLPRSGRPTKKFDIELLKNLALSMTSRLKKVVELDGGYTGY